MTKKRYDHIGDIIFGDPVEALKKSQEAREKATARQKKRLKGTGHTDRSFHRKMEDL